MAATEPLQGTRKVRVKGTKDVIIVNRTPIKLLKELEKPEEDRNDAMVRDYHTHAPYFDPNIHEVVDGTEDEAEEVEEVKPKPAAAAKKPAAKRAVLKEQPKPPVDDDDDDEDEDDDD